MIRAFCAAAFRWLTGGVFCVMLFFTFGVARKLFEAFPREMAGKINLELFPSYYFATLLSLAAAVFFGVILSLPIRRNFVGTALALLAFALLAANAFVIGPIMAGISLPGESVRFRSLHAVAMILNLIAMVFTLAAPFLIRSGRPHHGEKES